MEKEKIELKFLHDSIPVLMYHHVMPYAKDLNVIPEIFEEQISFLHQNRWKTLKGDEFLYLMQNSSEKRNKCVLITFDDGFLDNYIYAYPILKKYKIRAMLFVATEFICDYDIKPERFKLKEHKDLWNIVFSDRKYEVMCTWNEIKEMEADGVFDIQSHGHSHRIPEFIRKNDYEKIENDLKLSSEIIQSYCNKEPNHLAWPKGKYNEKTLDIAKRIGYKVLYTTERGINKGDLLGIKRIAAKCKGYRWLDAKLKIYSSSILSKIYSKIRL